MEPIVDVRDVNEHGYDEVGIKGKPVTRPQAQIHFEGKMSVDETSKITMNGEMFIGNLKLSDIHDAVEVLRKIAGFSSLV